MPISSSEIAQLNGAYMQASMQRMQYAGSIGSPVYGGMTGGGDSDSAMASVMNRASAVGGPLMSGAMGLAGLDPLSMGLKAGMGAFGAGAGLGGAALAGGAVALPLMAAGAAAHYAGGQMMTGAHQQMGLNQTLRSSFNFQNAHGGQGFNRGDMTSIGDMVRGMTEQFGPGGEITSFRELSGLAGKMGQMGFAQGVRDVREFSTRFKEMVSTLKNMAKDLGTTLDGAMEFAAAAKQSGVFGMGRTSAFTSAVRGATVSGGLAVSEVTGAASIGSQISRSFGGLGRQGAGAGIRTIGQIGTAQQMGVLSEEDIYNATGLTGSEGRQAFAASQMQRAGNFLQSGKGRRMLASMAGKDGTLDEASVQEFLSGGMSIQETMRLDNRMKSQVGRANFIRNEGRLRGAAMERLGAFLPAIQLQQWAQSKGIDINEMDDRSMLFAQRHLGMGRDELDAAVKMANNMPQIMEQQRRSEVSDSYFQSLAQQRKGQGIEGVKQRFEQAKELVNGKLQKVGQDVFNAGSEAVDSFFNKLFGTYVQTHSKDIDDLYRTSLQGGAAGRGAAQRGFGVGGSGLNAAAMRAAAMQGPIQGLGGAAAGDLARSLGVGSMGGLEDSFMSDLRGGRSLGGALLGGETGRYLLHGQSGAGRLREAGFNIQGMNSAEVRAKLLNIQNVQRAAATGFSEADVAAGAKAGSWIREAYSLQRSAGEADDRIQGFGNLLEHQAASGDPEARALAARWKSSNQAERAALMANLERGAGIQGKGGLAARYGLPEGGMAAVLARAHPGGFASIGGENRAFAQAFGVRDERGGAERFLAQQAGRGLAGAVGLLTSLPGASRFRDSFMAQAGAFGEDLIGRITGSYEKQQRAGEFIKGDEFRNLTQSLLSNDRAVAAASIDRLDRELGSLGKADENSPVNQVKRDMLRASKFAQFMAGKPNATEEEQAAEAHRLGMPLGEMRQKLGSMANIMSQRQRTDMAEGARRARARAGKDLDQISALGIYAADGKLTVAAAKGLSAEAQKYAEISMGIVRRESQYAGTAEGVEGDLALFGQNVDAGAERGHILEGLSVGEKRKLAAALQGTEAGSEVGRSAAMQTRLAGLARRKGQGAAVAQILGSTGMTREQLSHLDLTGAGAAQVLAGAGISDKSLVEQLQQGAKGGQGGLAEALRRIVESSQYTEQQKKKQLDAQEQNDPLQAAIKDNTAKANRFLEALVKSNTQAVAALDALNKTSDPEGAPQPGGQNSADVKS